MKNCWGREFVLTLFPRFSTETNQEAYLNTVLKLTGCDWLDFVVLKGKGSIPWGKLPPLQTIVPIFILRSKAEKNDIWK